LRHSVLKWQPALCHAMLDRLMHYPNASRRKLMVAMSCVKKGCGGKDYPNASRSKLMLAIDCAKKGCGGEQLSKCVTQEIDG